MIPRARADGFEKYFVVCTRPRGFRRSMKPNRVYDAFFWHRPAMRAAMNSWNRRYNEALDDLERLESGEAPTFSMRTTKVSLMSNGISRS